MEKLVITKSTHASEYLQLGLRPEHRADIKLIYKNYICHSRGQCYCPCVLSVVSLCCLSLSHLCDTGVCDLSTEQQLCSLVISITRIDEYSLLFSEEPLVPRIRKHTEISRGTRKHSSVGICLFRTSSNCQEHTLLRLMQIRKPKKKYARHSMQEESFPSVVKNG